MKKASKIVISWALAFALVLSLLPGSILVVAAAEPAEEQTHGFADGDASLGIRELARYSTGYGNADGGIQEIVTYNHVNGFSYSVNGLDGVLTAINLEGLQDSSSTVATLAGININVSELVSVDGFTYGDMTSVAVSPDGTKLAVAIQEEDYSAPGLAAVFSCGANGSLTLTGTYETGVQPDMVVFADNNTVLTADEGEPRMGYYTTGGAVDPKGSVTIINLAGGTSSVVDFTAYDSTSDGATTRGALVSAGVVLKKDTEPSVDLEPEYIAVAGGKAYVTLQEASAVAVLDLATKTFTGIYSLGVQDFSTIPVDLDNKKSVGYTPRYYEDTFGLRMPDGIAAYQTGGKTYILTANEGDSREWAAIVGLEDGEKDPITGVENDETDDYLYLNEAESLLTASDGAITNKTVRHLTSDYEGQPGLDNGSKYYLFGSRSFTLFEVGASDMTKIYDSGDDFEAKTFEYMPNYFNCSNDDIDKDSRSNKKGPEPESVTTGTIGDKTYAFITLERIGGIMIYDITDPENVSFVNYINSRDFEDFDDEENLGKDNSAEGLKFIPASESPTGGNLLLTAFEVSGDVAAYAVAPRLKLAVISDDHLFNIEEMGDGPAFDEYLLHDRKMLKESEAILDEVIAQIRESDVDYVLLAGDLTKDGEKYNHELLASKLAVLEADTGKQVFVINGNHDLSNQNAFSYIEASPYKILADTVDRTDFRTIYEDFGYSEAIAQDSNSLSYAVNLGDDHRLIVIDSCKYSNNKEAPHQDTGGELSSATLTWVLGQVKSAVQDGRRPIGMMHHGLVPHTAVQPIFFPEYLVDNYTTVAQTFADAGLNLVFTGHFHSQDVAVTQTAAGNKLYDVETGSLVTYPSPIRYVTLYSSEFSYTSEPVEPDLEDIAAEYGFEYEESDFETFAKAYLMTGLEGQVPGMLIAVNDDLKALAQTDPVAAMAMATTLADTDLGGGLTLGTFLASCMAGHYAGDETPLDASRFVEPYGTLGDTYATLIGGMQMYTLSDDTAPLYRMLGNAAWALTNDTTGNLSAVLAGAVMAATPTELNALLENLEETTPDNESDSLFVLSALPVSLEDDNDNSDDSGGSYDDGPYNGGTNPVPAPAPPAPTPTPVFNDTANHWASNAIAFVTARGLFTGTTADSFSPESSMTRGMLVTVLHRLANLPAGGSMSFGDVPSGMYYAQAVTWASQNGIVEGVNGSFMPDDNITREQLATILYRYTNPGQTNGSLDNFSDSGSVSSWASDAMSWAVSIGLFNGNQNGNLNPGGNATRAEVAAILQRYITYMGI